LEDWNSDGRPEVQKAPIWKTGILMGDQKFIISLHPTFSEPFYNYPLPSTTTDAKLNLKI
jgi:hypothetical protein